MARTKASVGAKVSSGKSSKARCSAAPPPTSTVASGSSDRSARSLGGGNPVCPRPTPKWQRSITNFLISKDVSTEDDGAGASSSKPRKRNVIESDDEEDTEPTPAETEPTEERPKNTELDETLELQPLTGDDSHKIEDYYPKNNENGENDGDHQNGENSLNGENLPNKRVKGKGKGKKTNKENVKKNNNENRKSLKRDLEETNCDDELVNENVNKKIKVN